MSITLPEGMSAPGDAKVERLGGSGSLDREDVTWRREKWTYENNGIPKRVQNDTKTVQVHNRSVEIRANAIEVVLITF